MTDPNPLYAIDKRQVRASFDRAASSYDEAAVLQHEVGRRLQGRLDFINFTPERILDLGCGTGRNTAALGKRFRKAKIVACDLAMAMLKQSRRRAGWFSRQRQVCGDAEALPFADDSFDLIFSSLAIQWCQDLPHTFGEFRRILRPGGLLLFTTFGPDTLKELRASWSAVDGHNHVNAFIDMHDIGDAMIQAGLAHPVMDGENIILTYSQATDLMRELKAIGAHNVTSGRNHSLTGKTRINKVKTAYEQFRDRDGRLPATYEVLYGHAWAPEVKSVGEVTIPLGGLSGSGHR